MSNAVKNFDIIATSLSIPYNFMISQYFNDMKHFLPESS